jgi:chemotaxis protein CheZ
VQRKVFRIEQMDHRRPALPLLQRGDADGLARELITVRAVLADVLRDLAAVLNEGKEQRMTRAAGELGAAVEAMEKATVKILQSAETIDDCAKALGATQKTDYGRGVAQDIQEHVTQLYVACNFQDLAGQRIGKVIATLGLIEQRVTQAIARCKGAGTPGAADAPAPPGDLINGPRLDGEGGHASQRDVDVMFA